MGGEGARAAGAALERRTTPAASTHLALCARLALQLVPLRLQGGLGLCASGSQRGARGGALLGCGGARSSRIHRRRFRLLPCQDVVTCGHAQRLLRRLQPRPQLLGGGAERGGVRRGVALPQLAVLGECRHALRRKPALLLQLRRQRLALERKRLAVRTRQVDVHNARRRGQLRPRHAAAAAAAVAGAAAAARAPAPAPCGAAGATVVQRRRRRVPVLAAQGQALLRGARRRQQLLDALPVLHLLQPQGVVLRLQRQQALALLKQVRVRVAQGLRSRCQVRGCGRRLRGGWGRWLWAGSGGRRWTGARTFCRSRTSSARLRFSARSA